MPATTKPRVFRLRCAKCNTVIVCPESIVDTGGACSNCGHIIEIRAYEPLCKILEEREAEHLADKQRREQERLEQQEVLRLQREEERWQREQEQCRCAEEARLLNLRWQENERVRAQELAQQQEHDTRQAALSNALVPAMAPTYGALRATAALLWILGLVDAAAGVVILLIAAVLLLHGIVALQSPLARIFHECSANWRWDAIGAP